MVLTLCTQPVLVQSWFGSGTGPEPRTDSSRGATVRGLPAPGLLQPDGAYRLKITFDGRDGWSTRELRTRGSTAVWAAVEDKKEFEGTPDSTLKVVLYQNHHRRSAEEVGWAVLPLSIWVTTNAESRRMVTQNRTTAVFVHISVQEVMENDHLAPSLGAISEAKEDALPLVQQPSLHGTAPANGTNSARTQHEDNMKRLQNDWIPLMEKINAFWESASKTTEENPFSRMASQVVSTAYKVVLPDHPEQDRKIAQLVEKMQAVYAFISQTQALQKGTVQEELLARLSKKTLHCAQLISDYMTKTGRARRLLLERLSNEESIIDAYVNSFDGLLVELGTGSQLRTEIVTVKLVSDIRHLADDMIIRDIPYAADAGYAAGKCCLAGTRRAILDEITRWVRTDRSEVPPVFVLMGPAGSGKSTIAHTIANKCMGSQQLGSMFCFNRSEASTRKPESLFRNIASDLCTKWPAFRAALSKHLDGNKALCTTTDLDTQFDSFILGPARLVAINGTIVIIIDALDESGAISTRQQLLRILVQRLKELPLGLRFLITTRAEPDIVRSLKGSTPPDSDPSSLGSSVQSTTAGKSDTNVGLSAHNAIQTYRLDDEEDDTQLRQDITEYIQHELPYTNGTLPPQLPRDAHLILAKKAGRLFQWAAVACSYIKTDHPGSEPKDRYEELVQGTHPGLDALYGTVLECFNREGSRVLQSFKRIMGFILTAVEPLSQPSLLDLLEQLDQDERLKATTILPYLEPLLSGVGPGDTRPVRPLHSSFFDLLQSEEDQNPYFVGATGHHERLAKSTLRLLQRDLRFNMANLETSYRLNADLSEAQRAAISDQLSYACKYWGRHLQMSDEAVGHEVADLLKMLFLDRFLFWLEAASLAGIVSFVPHCISSALIRLHIAGEDVTQAARDGIKFVRTFVRPMSDSAAHVYISALAWAPPNSTIAKRYGSQFPFIPRVCSGGMSAWPSTQVLRGHIDDVRSVAFSADGSRIVSGSKDKTVRVWDAVRGQPVGDPLVGHEHWHWVSSVAFSPDGSRILSGSHDKTLRVWNTETGQRIGEPLVGHEDWVTSVAFSPDGSRIVSGSEDKTVRVVMSIGETVRTTRETASQGLSQLAGI
ncbi:hypothetical protein CALCODRAFT_478617 [Calocera cornea HHB12733]|uniref:Nephrocystin 3-like N-terminal domain-containing protein n=1 Tax=Calocera cornea HHB12733 TaxID=1353952 RepID=A0A165C2K2_9BASI|nr:hypothetical protein CALCODRAFT_478617 [Calocera cornea HHB12733]